MELQHAGENGTFTAVTTKKNRGIKICHEQTDDIEITIAPEMAPISLICPSIDGRVLWVSLKDSSELFYDTVT